MSDRSDDIEFVKWAKAIKVRDNFECVICGARGVYLEAHHINGWNAYPEQRYDLDNGVSLCRFHHDKFHELYSKGNNNIFQWKQYLEIIGTFKKLLTRDNPPEFLTKVE